MSIVFQKSGLSDLTIERGRLFPFSPKNITVHQDRYLTESNNAKIVDYGANLQLIKLSFKNLTKDNYDGAINGLKTWFETSNINWSVNSFTMIDESGVSYTVRFWQKDFQMPQQVNGRYEITLILKVE